MLPREHVYKQDQIITYQLDSHVLAALYVDACSQKQPSASETNAEWQPRRNSSLSKPAETSGLKDFRSRTGGARTEVELPERSAPNLLPQLKLPSDHVLHPRRGPRNPAAARFTHEPRRRSFPTDGNRSHCQPATRFEPRNAQEE